MIKRLTIATALFLAGFMAHSLINAYDIQLISRAEAEVAGMDYIDLKQDYDFKKAVQRVVEQYCTVDGEDISC